MNVLAVGAHPDDVELGCFGTLARHRAQGDKIFGAIITRGELSANPEKRQKETEDAAKLIGMKLYYGNFPDGNCQADSALVLFLDNIVKKHKIDIMYTHTEHDRHQDHRNVAKASISAARDLKELYAYETPSVIAPFSPQMFIDITSTIKTKVNAIKKHKSQEEKLYMGIESSTGIAKFRAYQCRLKNRYCEAFEVHKILRK